MTEHVILVAFVVDTDLAATHGHSRAAAEQHLIGNLVPILNSRDPRSAVQSWWVAEDLRQDGSDNDSAVFVRPGQQAAAASLLHQHGLTGAHNALQPLAHQRAAIKRAWS